MARIRSILLLAALCIASMGLPAAELGLGAMAGPGLNLYGGSFPEAASESGGLDLVSPGFASQGGLFAEYWILPKLGLRLELSAGSWEGGYSDGGSAHWNLSAWGFGLAPFIEAAIPLGPVDLLFSGGLGLRFLPTDPKETYSQNGIGSSVAVSPESSWQFQSVIFDLGAGFRLPWRLEPLKNPQARCLIRCEYSLSSLTDERKFGGDTTALSLGLILAFRLGIPLGASS
jgi:hypothetical protein